MRKQRQELGAHLYRIALLCIMFAVLWVKEYLWSAFILALLLLLANTLIIPILQLITNMSHEDVAPRRTRTRRSKIPAQPAGTDEEDAGPIDGGEMDFREPMPGRSSPRRKGP